MMCDKTSALAALNILGDAINDLMNHSETKLTIGDILRAQNDLYDFINQPDSQDVIDALERQTKKMTSFLEENQFSLPQPGDHSAAPSSSWRIHEGGDEEKEPILQSHQEHKLN